MRPTVLIALRACLGFGSEGEREGFSIRRQTTLEARSRATGRESGCRWIEKNRAQPGIQNLRGCSSFESEGERDEISRGFGPAFEGRSSATGRESGIEDAERPRVQPRSKT